MRQYWHWLPSPSNAIWRYATRCCFPDRSITRSTRTTARWSERSAWSPSRGPLPHSAHSTSPRRPAWRPSSWALWQRTWASRGLSPTARTRSRTAHSRRWTSSSSDSAARRSARWTRRTRGSPFGSARSASSFSSH